MKYIANPVEVEAFKIEEVLPGDDEKPMILKLENGKLVSPNHGMLARMTPVPGDYWVVQADGYVYLNPKEVFETKYHPERRVMPRLKIDKDQFNLIHELQAVVQQFKDATMNMNGERIAAAHEAAEKVGF
jgi:hypothetical protein